jgi:hypothetical protein
MRLILTKVTRWGVVAGRKGRIVETGFGLAPKDLQVAVATYVKPRYTHTVVKAAARLYDPPKN